MSMNGRLGRLEAAARGQPPCQACGLRPGERAPLKVLYPDVAPPDPPRRCAECGGDTELRLRVTYDDLPPEAGEGVTT